MQLNNLAALVIMYAFTRARCLDTVVDSANATYWKFGLPENCVVGGVAIAPVVSVMKLEVHFDTHMTMRHHFYSMDCLDTHHSNVWCQPTGLTL